MNALTYNPAENRSILKVHPKTKEEGINHEKFYQMAEEVRYAPDTSRKLLGFASYRSGDMAYIDDGMAFHQVGNPYGRPAVSIHIYLKKSY